MWLKRLGETLLASDDEDEELMDSLGFNQLLGTAKRFVDTANEVVLGGTFGELLAPAEADAPQKRLVVCVVGSDKHDPPMEACVQLGRWVAQIGANLMTGGCNHGVAGLVARAYVETPDRPGCSIGVIPADATGSRPQSGFPGAFVEVPIQTHLTKSGPGPQSRDPVVILSSDVVVAVVNAESASDPHTHGFVRLAVQHQKPVCLLLAEDCPESAVEQLVTQLKTPLVRTIDELEVALERAVAGAAGDETVGGGSSANASSHTRATTTSISVQTDDPLPNATSATNTRPESPTGQDFELIDNKTL
eukprot:m.131971 g.131971  ORF g.131971 m.131971 type:complete len:305 (-) comp16837_c0_seq1:71-985(-)